MAKGEQLLLLNSGFPSLRAAKLFPLGMLSVVHGASGSGKSTFVFQVNVGTAIDLVANGTKGCVAINSLEMTDVDVVARVAGILAHVDISNFMDGSVTGVQMERLNFWLDFASRLPIYVDDTSFVTTSAVQYRASGLHLVNGPVVQLSSDYTELFRDDANTEEQRVSKIAREHLSLSRTIGASVLVISQSTASNAAESKSYIAGPDATRHSRGPRHAADILCELWNPVQIEASGIRVVAPEGYSKDHPWLFVQKFRNSKAGVAIPLGWRAETTTFFDLSVTQTPGKETVYDNLPKALAKLGMTPPGIASTGAW